MHTHITTTTLIPGSVCVQFSKMGLIPLEELHSHGIVPPSQKAAAASLTEKTSFLFVFTFNYSVSGKEVATKLPPIPRIKCSLIIWSQSTL